MSQSKKELILDHLAIQKKINRIAFEVYESNYVQKALVIAGIGVRGSHIADEVASKLVEISSLAIRQIAINKVGESGEVEIDSGEESIQGKAILIIDDVLYSGRTMFNAIAASMNFQPGSVQMAVLIDRGHRSIPVRPDFVGLELATTLKQHVSVEISKKGNIKAYLL